MSKIVKQDTNGVKPLLAVGELGYDNYPSGGDKGRVYVGDGTVNIALAKKSEVDVKVVANVSITAGTATKVTYDAKGLVTSGTNPTTISGYGITDAYTKAELNAGQLDNRYYTETEVNAALALKVDDTEIASVNLLRADKYLAAQNIAAMVYTGGDLTKIQYNNATDVNYEVLNYTSGNLTSISHYTTSVLRGTTTLSYLGGNLVSAIFA